MCFSEVQRESKEESPSPEEGQKLDMQKEKERGKGREGDRGIHRH